MKFVHRSKTVNRSFNLRELLLDSTRVALPANLLCALGTAGLAQQTTGTLGSPSATTTIAGGISQIRRRGLAARST